LIKGTVAGGKVGTRFTLEFELELEPHPAPATTMMARIAAAKHLATGFTDDSQNI